MIASLGAATYAADTLGYVVASPASLSSRLPVLLPPLAAVAIAARLWIHVRRRTDDPTLAMMASGLVLALLGGARFAAFLIPLAVRPTRPHAVNPNEQVPT